MSRPFEIPIIGYRRNLHLFSGNGSYLGGLYLNKPSVITNEDLYDFCGHFLLFPSSNYRWRLHRLGPNNSFHEYIPRNSGHLTPGRYVALGNTSQVIDIGISSERPMPRIPTHQPSTSHLGPNQLHLRDTLRARDHRCAITGISSPTARPFTGLIACHIFPVARHRIWLSNHYQRWITDTTNPNLIGPNGIFSAQNGILLSTQAHVYFDTFMIAVNPDRGYRIISLVEDILGVGGRRLSATTRPNNDPNTRVSIDALRWHFHQAILTHMRGVGTTFWDLDSAGGDYMGMVLDDPDAAEIMEIEMGNRLTAYVQVS
ncbi:HNH endonuclease-domain-containing protein [Aspergillus coremiiformis]|uniref:HNH endonuclease-domain-containing protein n=1 Tax=Aspergillus coremiiformis TaxID=138285 RepID=A0A5N6YYI2_9EURO|nr:HNH endonuclease-domain-containing protein [Aspergillus coremiiformis]